MESTNIPDFPTPELPLDLSEEMSKEEGLPELPEIPDRPQPIDHNGVVRSVFGETQVEGQRWMQNVQHIGFLTSDALNTIEQIKKDMGAIPPITELLAPSSSLFPEQVAINERNHLLKVVGTLIVIESHLRGIRQERDTLDRELRRRETKE